MEQNLSDAAQAGDVNALYALLRHDPNVLERIDKISFTDTPLHIAASAGCTHFALEMIRLKPSFGRKLNPDGLSPLDLALRNGHTETARRLANYEPELICVQGREGVTPLHYAAETDDADLLAEFLLTCPASMENLTIRGETVVYIAVRNGSFRAFKVLLGWLQRADKLEILNWRNEEGNTVLHIAAYTNQTEVMKLLMKKVEVNDKNFEGLTALDILMRHPGGENAMAKKLLTKAGASKSSSLLKMGTLADFLSTRPGIREKLIGLDVYLSMGLSSDMRNAILVVAVLVATATFQAVLQPPEGVSQGGNNLLFLNNTNVNATTTTNTTITTDTNITSGDGDPIKAVITNPYFCQFIFWNSISFAASLGIIYILLPPNRYISLLYTSLVFLMLDYINAALVITPSDMHHVTGIVIYLGFALFCILTLLAKKRIMPRKVTVLRRMTGNNFHHRREMEKFFSLCKYYSSRSDN